MPPPNVPGDTPETPLVPEHVRQRAADRFRRVVYDEPRTRAQRRKLYRRILREEIRKEYSE